MWLVAGVLFQAIEGLQAQQVHSRMRNAPTNAANVDVDWQALWTFAIGPELELASALRYVTRCLLFRSLFILVSALGVSGCKRDQHMIFKLS